jgi:hypothetical protein
LSSGLDDYIDYNDIDTDDIEGHDMEAVEQILQTINLNVMGAAATKAREAKEQLILTCRKHIKMARAQRVLYQQKEQEARDDVKQQVPHSQRRVTITADFGQNIEIPCFNSQFDCRLFVTMKSLLQQLVVLVLSELGTAVDKDNN